MGMLYAAVDISMQKAGWVKWGVAGGGALPRVPSLIAPARPVVRARSADPVGG